ncbi:MAG: hypothetical protein PUI75_05540, partial [Subdoligranulum sp.]|nr:hypothetical protein [Subdoligranulum sp.]
CPCFGSLFPPLAALTFAASSIICAFGLASAAPRSPYRHLELCGIALITLYKINVRLRAVNAAGPHIFVCRRIWRKSNIFRVHGYAVNLICGS